MPSTIKKNMTTYLAGAAISRGMAVKFGADEKHVVKCAANTDSVMAIAQNDAVDAEQMIECAHLGGAVAKVSGVVSKGKFLVPHTSGALEQANASGDHVIAQALEDGVDGQIISVEVVKFIATGAGI